MQVYQTHDLEHPGMSDSTRKLTRLGLPNDLAGKSVLDIGCNEGFFCRIAKERGASRVVGIDFDRTCLEAAIARYGSLGIDFRCRSWDTLPEGKFDCIIWASAMHYERDPKRVVALIRNSLNPDGLFILECGMIEFSSPDMRYMVRHSDICTYPTRPYLEDEILADFAVREVAPPELTPGDPVPRAVFHCVRAKPEVVIVRGPSGSGKSSFVQRCFSRRASKVVHLDRLMSDLCTAPYAHGDLLKFLKANFNPDDLGSLYLSIDQHRFTEEYVALLFGLLSPQDRLTVIEGFITDLQLQCLQRRAAMDFIVWEMGKPGGISLNSNAPSCGTHGNGANDSRGARSEMRDFLASNVPPGARVLVVSQGDDSLLNLTQQPAEHFPQNGQGGYLGFHPTEGSTVIAQLDNLRAKGAEFLFVPYSSTWWLEYYRSSGWVLDKTYRRLAQQKNAGVIFDLRSPPATEPKPEATLQPWEQVCAAFQTYTAAEGRAEEVAHLVAPFIRRVLTSGRQSELFAAWERHGVHVTQVQVCDPIPVLTKLRPELWEKESALAGIDLNEANQLELLSKVFPRFQPEFNRIPYGPTNNPHEFHFNNGNFDGTDALVFFCMLRHFEPQIILQTGSEFALRLAAQASREDGTSRLICLESAPSELLQKPFPGLSQLIQKPLQETPLRHFEELAANDILFVDSSHVSKIGSDVNCLFLEILPQLKPGVIVHINGIYLPWEYPRPWIDQNLWFWNEQYLLQAFLQFNSDYEVLIANNYLGQKYNRVMRSVFPKSPWWGGSSFWMRRKVKRDEKSAITFNSPE